MLQFRMRTLSTAQAGIDSLACWEIKAFFCGFASVDDLEIDRDEATEWFINNFIDSSMRERYLSERQMAEDEMLESFHASLEELIRGREKEFGKHYPFFLEKGGHLCRRPLSELTPVSFSYLALQFFRALKGDLIEIDGHNDLAVKSARQRFERHFREIFEYIAAYAVSGSRSGEPIMTSDCRSAERLHGLLGCLCKKIGSGKVRMYSDWNEKQKKANDGGVDCVVHVGGPGMPGNAYLMLVGATVQEVNIKHKIIGRDEREFFSSFFSSKPGAFQSVLVRPQDADELTRLTCNDQDCLFYSYEEVWKGMAAHASEGITSMAIKRLNVRARKLLSELKGMTFVNDYDVYNCAII